MSTNGDQITGRRLSRRRFIQAGTAVGIGVVASGYVKPAINSVGVPAAFASSSPIPDICQGLTPGFWKNWRNHYTDAQMTIMCAGTIAPTIADVDAIFASYDDSPGMELTILRAFVLANELTIFLTFNPGYPNPSGGYLTSACEINGRTVNDCLGDAYAMLNKYAPGAPGVDLADRPATIAIKDCLDAFANL